jgi:hypothetical protein
LVGSFIRSFVRKIVEFHSGLFWGQQQFNWARKKLTIRENKVAAGRGHGNAPPCVRQPAALSNATSPAAGSYFTRAQQMKSEAQAHPLAERMPFAPTSAAARLYKGAP